MELKKPIPVPHASIMMGVVRQHRPYKWKVEPGIKDQYRNNKRDIMTYDWSIQFLAQGSRDISIKFFYSNSYDSYQVTYYCGNASVLTLMIAYDHMTENFFINLACCIVSIKAAHYNTPEQITGIRDLLGANQ